MATQPGAVRDTSLEENTAGGDLKPLRQRTYVPDIQGALTPGNV